MFEQLKFNASLLKDSVMMRTTLFASKEGPYRKDETMKTEYSDDAAKAEAIKSFMEGFYKEQGQKRAKDIIQTINDGILFNREPVDYQDHVADQDDLMMSIAAYVAQAGPEGQIKQNHMTNKFLVKLNETCEYLGMRKYVIITDEQLNTRQVIWDAPDYSRVSPEMAEALKKELADTAQREKERKERMEKLWKDAEEYNAKLREEALKELEEENKKKAEKEAKKAEKKAKKETKKANKEAQKEDTKKAEEEIKESKKINLDENIGQPSFTKSHDRGRAGMTNGSSAASSTKKSSASKDAGKGGKSEDSGDGDPDPASQKVVDLNKFISTEEVMKNFPIIDVDEEEKKRLLAQNERERMAFIRANGGNQLRSNPGDSEATKKKAAIDATLANGGVPDMAAVEDAIKSVESELTKMSQGAVMEDSGRFLKNEIKGRSDIELIQEALNKACSSWPGASAVVTPAGDLEDQYMIAMSYNGVLVDTFTAYGSRLMGKGVPVIKGIAIRNNGKHIPYFIPIHSMRALRSYIFRNMSIKNINGEILEGEKGLPENLAAQLEGTICPDYTLFDHLDLSVHEFTTNQEAFNFFFVVKKVLDLMQQVGGYPTFDSLPRYRVTNYKKWDNFELHGDQIAFDERSLCKADTTTKDQKEQLGISGPDNRRITVSGNNVQIEQPDGNTVNAVIA